MSREREGFGVKLADRESVQIKLGEVAQQIQIGRLLTMHAAWMLEQGGRARKEVSMAKVQVADTLHNAADVAIQLQGARGYSKDTIVNGSTAPHARRDSLMVRPKCTRWCWRVSCARKAGTSGNGARARGGGMSADAFALRSGCDFLGRRFDQILHV